MMRRPLSASLSLLALALLAGCGGIRPGSAHGGAAGGQADGGLPPSFTSPVTGRPEAPSSPASAGMDHGGTGGLTPLFRRLAALEATRTGTIDIVQLGDSHTAGGVFTTRLRDALQGRFGNAGPGFMPPGKPFIGSRRADVSVGQDGRWQYFNSLADQPPQGWGISGFIARSHGRGASLTLTPKDGNGFDSIAVEVVRQPGGGDLAVEVDDSVVKQIATDGPAGQAQWVSLPASGRMLRLVAADARPVDIAGWAVDRDQPGVVFDSAGVVGATIATIDRWNPDTVAAEIGHRAPALIILAYGTNEGFQRDLDLTAYGARFQATVARLRKAAPDAAIVVLGPMDGQTQSAACKHVADKDAVHPCVAGAPPPGKCVWYTPPSLAAVRTLQRSLADKAGYVFWDWSQVMPRVCGMDSWLHQTPPLGRGDHVHLTADGYVRGADAFYAWLMEQYRLWKQPF